MKPNRLLLKMICTVCLYVLNQGLGAQQLQNGQCDYSDAQLYGGWGWNPVRGESCAPLDSVQTSQGQSTDDANTNDRAAFLDGYPVCELSGSDSDNDGWGWENDNTCIVAADEPAIDDPVADEIAANNNCIDSDGDGWGWNGIASCQVQVADAPHNTSDLQTSCVDSDGDGWGWNGTSSCVSGETSDPLNDATSDNSNDTTNDNSNDTSDDTLVTGSCSQPASGTTVVSSTGPVRSTGNSFYPDNGPQCVTPTNQFNGPGLGFGDFLLLNNAWNGDKSSWSWSQCIALATANDGSVIPSWSYDWGNEDDLQPGYQEWEVKSYPEIIYGVKSADQESAPCETTGLPVPYSKMPSIDISYNFRAPQTNRRTGDQPDDNNTQQTVSGGDRNIAIESFLHSSCEIKRGSDSNREFELMVWLQHGNERLPSGSPPVAVYTDNAGRNFDVYVKIPADPGYIAYVAQEQSTSGTINWNEFFTDAKNNAGTYGVKNINSNWCLANILFGSEIWWGEGSFTMDYLQIKRSY